MPLRDYQVQMDQKRRASRARSRCNQLPTGAGKSHLIQQAARDSNCVVAMAHREYLLDQLHELMPEAQVIKAGDRWDRKSKKIIGMVQTLCRRDKEDLPNPDLIITDECHHARARSWRIVSGYWPDAQHDGYTATPIRTDGQGLDDVFDELICGPQYGNLIKAGWLKPFELYSIPSGIDIEELKTVAGDYSRQSQDNAIRKSTVFGDVVEYWRNLGRDGAHISFWPSIESAEHAAEQVPGWEVIHSKLPKEIVRERIRALEAGTIFSLANVDLVGEGLNIRGICSVSRCRATQSLALYIQQSGRANRGGSGVARVISHVPDWRIHGHGFPDDDREWSLAGRIRRKREASGAVPVWDCPECWMVNRSSEQCCVQCGLDKPREIRLTEQIEARLELITRADRGDIHAICSTPEEYLQFAKAKGKRPCWAAYQWSLRGISHEPDPGNPFLIDTNPRPTRKEYLRAAWELGLDPKYAAISAREMRLQV